MVFIAYSASVIDGLGSRKTVEAYANPTDLTGEPAGLNAWLALLDGVIDGVIVDSHLRVNPVLPGTLATSARVNFGQSRVEQNGEFRFNLTGTPKHYTQAVPAFAYANISNGKPNLTAVAPYTTLMLGDGFTSPDGLPLSTLYGAFLGTRKVRRQLQRSSFTTP